MRPPPPLRCRPRRRSMAAPRGTRSGKGRAARDACSRRACCRGPAPRWSRKTRCPHNGSCVRRQTAPLICSLRTARTAVRRRERRCAACDRCVRCRDTRHTNRVTYRRNRASLMPIPVMRKVLFSQGPLLECGTTMHTQLRCKPHVLAAQALRVLYHLSPALAARWCAKLPRVVAGGFRPPASKCRPSQHNY